MFFLAGVYDSVFGGLGLAWRLGCCGAVSGERRVEGVDL